MHKSQNSIFANHPRGFFPVIAALAGNFLLMIAKFFGFAISGSAAMFSEAIHSLADTMNQGLLLVGIRRSLRVADDGHTYGYGHERFIWALISACGVFFVGAGITIYKGVTSLMYPHEIVFSPLVFIILLIALFTEIITFFVAYRELRKHSEGMSIQEALRDGDPTTISVLYEDGVAILGVLVALLGITFSYYTHTSYGDAMSSIIIGMMLVWIAVLLINKNREFLTGKAMPEDLKDEIIALLEAEPAIEKVIDFKSTSINIGEYRIKCEVEFNGTALLREIREAGDLRDDFDVIRDDYGEFVRFCSEFIDRIPRLIGNKIDEIEKKIQAEVPGVKHIDIEIN
ncbi:MAG: cation diffusion facilitator family transporter [Patescibacteria group bacterium]